MGDDSTTPPTEEQFGGADLPEAYRLEGLLPGGQASVHRARLDGRLVVLRISDSADPEGWKSELSALASIDHPGVARLLDHGILPGDQGVYVTREWIEGQDLLEWSKGRSATELGHLAAKACMALDHIHVRGFVHGDLKPENVIVRPDGTPVVTDFGLAHPTLEGSQARPAGTLYSVAPEVLIREGADFRSDLFSIGVLLHQLLLGRRASASDFYARFPQQDFWEASGTEPEDLPTWARDIAVELLSVDPGCRPGSAREVGRTLASRLDLDLPDDPEAIARESLRVPIRAGREEWFERWTSGLSDRGALQWLRLPDGEQPEPIAEELRLLCALRGEPCCGASTIRELDAIQDTLGLDRWARELVDRATPWRLLVSLGSSDSWRLRGVECLARAISQRNDSEPAAPLGRLVVLSNQDTPPAESTWEVENVQALEPELVRSFLRERFADSSDRLSDFADILTAESGGAVTRIRALLIEAHAHGWILTGGQKPRLRAGPLPERLAANEVARSFPAPRGLARGAWMLLGAVEASGGRESIRTLARVADVPDEDLPAALRGISDSGMVSFGRADHDVHVSIGPGAEFLTRERVAEEHRRAIHHRYAEVLSERLAPAHRVLPHAWRADPGERVESMLVAEARALRSRGCAELAMALFDELDRVALGAPVPPGDEIEGERALTWCSLGQVERALNAIAPLGASERTELRALAERVRGTVAYHTHEPQRALEHFERAQDLDPTQFGDALLGRVHLLYELRRDEDVCRLIDDLRAAPEGLEALQQRQRVNVEVHYALSLFRRGEVERARELLDTSLERARAQGDSAWEAGLCINSGVLERHSGHTTAAVRLFERAESLHDASGNLSGIAQARAMLGATLRQHGDLPRAEPLLRSALEMRERLGDRVGSLGVRGMLGMLYADQGHPRVAIEELQRSADGLERAGRLSEALLYRARADEVSARIGSVPAAGRAGEADRANEGDPRILLCMTRARWLRGDGEGARETCTRAVSLARSLGHDLFTEEAEVLGTWLDRYSSPPAPDEPPAPEGLEFDASADLSLIAQDDALLKMLSRGTDGLDTNTARAFARRFAEDGRHDRAARLLLAVQSRCPESEWSADLEREAEELLSLCTRSLTETEAETFRRTLLGIPDPWPGDLIPRKLQRAHEAEEMEVTALLEINHRLLENEDLETLLGNIVENALDVSGAERGLLMLEEDGELRFDTAMDSRRGDIDYPDLEVSQSVVRGALERMKPLRVSNAVDDPLLGHAPSVLKLELRSILCVPFQVEVGLRGAIYVDHRLREGAFTPRAEILLSLLADQAALAIIQVRRLEEIRRLNRELNREVAVKESDLLTARRALRDAGLAAPASGLIGNSPVMRGVHQILERAAPASLPVLVVGQSGTGKELAARALHELSPRSDAPFVSENCAALPPTLIEAELFGAKKGAFTGSDRDRPGIFERAHGGTIFLDEIGEMPIELQGKLLRVLETSEVRRLGDERVRSVEFRLVAATNRDLEHDIREGRFRADLFYRLDGLNLRMPALAEHAEDIPDLVEHFFRLEKAKGAPERRVSQSVMAHLCRRPWPGNVRELFNELARLTVVTEGDIDDPELVRDPRPVAEIAVGGAAGVRTLLELEREAIEAALESTGNDKRQAAELLGISRSKLYQRLKEWNADPG